jgi:hypothetical protein
MFTSFAHSRDGQWDSIACRVSWDMLTLDRWSVLRRGSCNAASLGRSQKHTLRVSREASWRSVAGSGSLQAMWNMLRILQAMWNMLRTPKE